MFEHFTEKAINVVIESQRFAKELNHTEVCPEHFLLAIISEARGVSLKLLRMYNLNEISVKKEILKYFQFNNKAVKGFKQLENTSYPIGAKVIICNTDTAYPIEDDVYVLPLAGI